MASVTRNTIAKQILRGHGVSESSAEWKDLVPRVAWCVRFHNVDKRSSLTKPEIFVPYKLLHACGLLSHDRWTEQKVWAEKMLRTAKFEHPVTETEAQNNALSIKMDNTHLKKMVLDDIISQHRLYGLKGCLHQYRLNSEGIVAPQGQGQTVVVEYSSPNIAKPFHAGHLRSTIQGNFVSNINTALGHNVHRLNFLGDWGTQFGLLGVGFQKYGSDEKMKENAMQHLFDVYVRINQDVTQEREAGSDSSTHQLGKDFFRKMEQDDPEALKLWQYCRDCSIEKFSQVYQRLGVTFDQYDGEAMYHRAAHDIVQELRDKGLLQISEDTGVSYVDLSTQSEKKSSLYVNILKSDGTTLYVTRDIAAAIDRFKKYKFDRMHYLVENGQHLHFKQLFGALQKLGHSWAERPLEDFHIKFGRVEGMSTRKGDVVFLEDILNEARDRMVEVMKATPTTKQLDDPVAVADTLGVSAVIIQDLKQRRLKNYPFSWDQMIRFQGDTGVFLQYTHARLCSLERNCGVELNTDCDLSQLVEPQAIRLILQLAKYDEAVREAFSDLEPCVLTHYLFGLSNLVNSANEELYVKGQPADVAEARLLLFHTSRLVLASGMRLLGLTPLERM